MAAAHKNLRAVRPDDKPTKKLDVAEAAESGSHRALLVAMRDRIAKTVRDPECPPRDLAALTRRLQEIAKEIAALDLRDEEDARNEVASVDNTFDASAI